ncbi:MAG: molecular chaperone HtpG [Eubacteriales bacterium]
MPQITEKDSHEKMDFQAEVKQLLDIVVNSLYTEREIFLRELISNSADALEKYRYESITAGEAGDGEELPLEINIETGDAEHTLTVTDAGIGMTREELVENLGTIAHSGSKKFIEQLAAAGRQDLNLIGQFGVGFYAAFMVAKKIRVITRSYLPGDQTYEWSSGGAGSYSVGAAEGITRGTKIILELKDDAHEFAKPETVKRIIKQYSSFVPFPIKVDGEQVNTVQAIWTRNKNEVKEEEYTEFYKFVATDFEEPLYRLHFSADAPLAINALLFVPKNNFERFGFGRMDPGVNLYCRKILIQQHAKEILPEWLRFVKGVVDSEDIPLNISRETMQDSAVVARLRKVVTGRFLKFLGEQASEDREKYAGFWKTFGAFIKEGAASDFAYRDELAKLLRFETSKTEPGKLASLEDYIGRMKEGQKEIYFINGPSREIIDAGPYIEAFRANDLEVIYNYEPVDDFVLSSLTEYGGKKLISADQAGLELPAMESGQDAEPLGSTAAGELTGWLKGVLGDKVDEVRQSSRLVDSPAIIVNLDENLTSSMQRVMQAMNRDLGNLGRKALEVNTRHKLIKRLAGLREEDPEFARLVAEQVYDNAVISAGLAIEPRAMIERIYRILDRV